MTQAVKKQTDEERRVARELGERLKASQPKAAQLVPGIGPEEAKKLPRFDPLPLNNEKKNGPPDDVTGVTHTKIRELALGLEKKKNNSKP